LEDNFWGHPLPAGVKIFWANLGIVGQAGGLQYITDIGASYEGVGHAYFTKPARVYAVDGGGNTIDIIVHQGWNLVRYAEKSNGTTILTTNLLDLPSDLKWRLFM
jgi:hypothetical protein